MTRIDPYIVTEAEHGLVRVFHYVPNPDLPDTGDVMNFISDLDVGMVAANHIQRVEIKELGDMTLSAFLGAGYSIEQDKLDPYVAQLDGLGGVVFLMRSRAFAERPATLNRGGDAKLIATFAEPGVDVNFEPLPDESAKRPSIPAPEDAPVKKKPSDAAMSGRVATIALLVMAFLVWLMIKVAG